MEQRTRSDIVRFVDTTRRTALRFVGMSRSVGSGDGSASGEALAGEAEAAEEHQTTTDAVPLSRNAQKKLLKIQRAKEATLRKRIAKKESKKAATAKKKEESAAFLQQLTEDERAALQEQAKQKREARMQEAAEQKKKVKDALQSGLRIVIDLDFQDKMTEKEIKSLCQQLSYCYAVNSRAECPAHLHFTSLKGSLRETLGHQSTGFSGWAASMSEAAYEELYADRQHDMIYLTADAKDTLEGLEPDKVYIIGGLVDRNRYKRLCEEKAQGQGIATARLPIEQHINLAGTRVLTVNQVYAIMVHWLNRAQPLLSSTVSRKSGTGVERTQLQACKSWAQAVDRAVPERKRARSQDGATPSGSAGNEQAEAVPAAPDEEASADQQAVQAQEE